MTRVLYDYDPSASLGSEEAIAVFLADAFETGNSAYIAKALGVVARAKEKLGRIREHPEDCPL